MPDLVTLPFPLFDDTDCYHSVGRVFGNGPLMRVIVADPVVRSWRECAIRFEPLRSDKPLKQFLLPPPGAVSKTSARRATITTTPVAAARMALWANALPGWCDQDEPAAKILQTALGIWLVPEEIDKEDEQVLMTLRLVDDKYFDDIEDTKRRFRYRPRRVVTQDDIEAAGLVIHQANRVLLLEIARKKRWRATIDDGNAFLSDWSIIKRHLVQHLSFREIARDLGLDEAGIRRRFHDALASISMAFGPIQWPKSLSPHPFPYYRGARRTGRRPVWHHQLHIHEDREQILTAELDLVASFLAGGGAVQKLPDGLAVDFDTVDAKGHPIGHVRGKTCAAYVLVHLQNGPMRFAQLVAATGVPNTTSISRTLKRLCREGVITRTVLVDRTPPQTLYALAVREQPTAE
jgi:hypothetical protein